MTLARITVASLALIVPTMALAQHSGSMEDQLACTPDVYRFCAQQIPDEDAIVVCLKQHRAGLSPACQRVFSRPGGPAGPVSPSDD